MPGCPFPYEFPVEFADDGNPCGYNFLDTAVVGLGWLMRAREGRLTEQVYFTNQGSGTAAVYLVSFSTDAVSVSENEGYPLRSVPGWNLQNGYYAGVWDGQLQVTADVIADARSVPENILQFTDLLFLYTPPQPIRYLWQAVYSYVRPPDAWVFLNLGTGIGRVYLVSFGEETMEVSATEGDEGITGWNLGGGYYAGVWDGLLRVVTDVIEDAQVPPAGVSFDVGVLAFIYTPPGDSGLWIPLTDAA